MHQFDRKMMLISVVVEAASFCFFVAFENLRQQKQPQASGSKKQKI
jgi:hypothetical protein